MFLEVNQEAATTAADSHSPLATLSNGSEDISWSDLIEFRSVVVNRKTLCSKVCPDISYGQFKIRDIPYKMGDQVRIRILGVTACGTVGHLVLQSNNVYAVTAAHVLATGAGEKKRIPHNLIQPQVSMAQPASTSQTYQSTSEYVPLDTCVRKTIIGLSPCNY